MNVPLNVWAVATGVRGSIAAAFDVSSAMPPSSLKILALSLTLTVCQSLSLHRISHIL